jgi:flagellar M-ring protein FliF
VLNSFWAGLGSRSRVGFIAGLVVIVLATAALAFWTFRTEYDVLFADLSPQDAAAMTRELDQMKMPYRLGADGTSILVDRTSVHQTRLKVMGTDLPLSGAVGFELFNNADFGMTEFAQKINYQRALQGEITRTILSLAEVASARVHLAFPEEGLFKRERHKAKASVTLSLKHGQALRRDQVNGIQRLVAAAVPGVTNEDVTIVNQQGIALTHPGGPDGEVASSLRLDLKREIEQHLAQKATAVLEKAFGAGQAMASVDVTLDMNQVRTTTEDVTAPIAVPGDAPVGIVLRERETTRDQAPSSKGTDPEATVSGTSHREVDYQLGRRVEQVVSSPGTIARLQALAVLKTPLNAAQIDQVKALLGAAVGASRERGDTLIVQPLEGLAAAVASNPEALPSARAGKPAARPSAVASPDPASTGVISSAEARTAIWWPAALLALATLAVAALLLGRRVGGREPPPAHRTLTPPERQASLDRVRTWLVEDPSVARRSEQRS